MERFFLRLVKFGKISQAESDYASGKYNGYPECCIRYFMRFQAFGIPASIANALVLGDDSLEIPYVRCPKCRGIKVGSFDFHRFFPSAKAAKKWFSAYY